MSLVIITTHFSTFTDSASVTDKKSSMIPIVQSWIIMIEIYDDDLNEIPTAIYLAITDTIFSDCWRQCHRSYCWNHQCFNYLQEAIDFTLKIYLFYIFLSDVTHKIKYPFNLSIWYYQHIYIFMTSFW